MRFIDLLRLSFYNINKHKKQSLLSAVIVFLMSFISIFLIIGASSISKSIKITYLEYINSDSIFAEYIVDTEAKVKKTYNIIEKNTNLISDYSYTIGTCELYDTESIIELDLIDDSNRIVKNTNYCIVGKDKGYNLDDIVTKSFKIDDNIITLDFIVVGMIENNKMIIDMAYAISKLSKINLSVTFEEATIKNLDEMCYCYKAIEKYSYNVRGGGYMLDTYIEARQKGKLINAICVISSILISLLSVLTIINYIISLFNDNNRFYSLLSLFGSQKKDELVILSIESFLTVFVGAILACFFVCAFVKLDRIFVENIVNSIVDKKQIYSSTLNKPIVDIANKWYHYIGYIGIVLIITAFITILNYRLSKRLSPIEVLREDN